jgi:hypothetical protein
MWGEERAGQKGSCRSSLCWRQARSRISVQTRTLFHVALIVCCAAVTGAQETTPNLPDSPSASQSKKSSGSEGAPLEVVTFLSRRSIFFPDLATSQGPLSAAEKFKLFLDDSIAPSTLSGAALGAAVSQGADSPHGFRQGWDAYGKRFGASMARHASSDFFGTFLLASALHQDPRFFPQLNPTFGRSTKYSIERVFVTRNDEGKKVANWSQVVGMLLSESLANAYWPEEDRTAGQTFRRFGIDLGARAASNMFRNYWPSIFKNLERVTPGAHDRKN